MEIRLTERDRKLLELLASGGLVTVEQARQIYGGVGSYHQVRLWRLKKAGYITRGYGIIRPTGLALQVLGDGKKRIRLRKHQEGKRILATSVALQLSGHQVLIGSRAKKAYRLNNASRLEAVIENGDRRYAVYILVNQPKPKTLKSLWAEVTRLVQDAGIRRSLFFCTGSDVMGLLADSCPEWVLQSLDEVLLLPYPGGIHIVERLLKNKCELALKRSFPGLSKSQLRGADFSWRQHYIFVLAGNDLVRRYFLTRYLQTALAYERKNVIVVCLRDQLLLFRSLFPKVIFAILSDDFERIVDVLRRGRGAGESQQTRLDL